MLRKAGDVVGRKNTFSITDFAHFARTTRNTLIHYDKIGLLSPMSRGENGYRYYSSAQLGTINLIRTCQDLGMPLSAIKKLADSRTPEATLQLLDKQIKHIDKRLDEWVGARKLLHTLSEKIRNAIDVDEHEIEVMFMPAEAIVMGGINDYSRGRDDYDALHDFYYHCQNKYPDMNLNYPVWGTFSEERIKNGDWVWPDRYYFSNPEGLDRKPAALYAIGYGRGFYGHTDELYKRLMAFIDENGFEVCGPAYEEYPINEICLTDNDDYLIRVMITVRQKGKR